MSFAAALRRHAGWIRGVSALGVLVGLALLARALPVQRGIEALEAAVQDAGPWAPVLFGAAYVVSALLLVPGSALTLAAGALFGLLWGTALASLVSTVAAALAFLISRYLARDAVERAARTRPRFAAVDQAVAQGGWKVVMLLRLSPVFPYSILNYLFGVTGVRFLPYVLASWIGMLPGALLYVYLGHAGRAGLEAATGAAGRSTGEWALLGAGLVATLVATVYLTRLAQRRLRDEEAQLGRSEPDRGQA